MSEKPKVVVRVHRVRGHSEHHGGAWKVAYADFVTAMMAFFLVLWLVNQSPQVRGAVAGYMRDPFGAAGRGAGNVGTAPAPEIALAPDAQAGADPLQRQADDLLKALSALPDSAAVAGQIEVELTEEGLRVQLMESEDGTFFDLGSPKLSGRGVDALATVARVLGPLHHGVAVEGHTDSRPFAEGDAYSNWELSVDRANSARRILESHGIAPDRFRAVRGYAATRPRPGERPDDPRNRRIAILVMRDEAGRFAASLDGLAEAVRR